MILTCTFTLTSTVKPCPNGLPGQFADRREGYVRIPIDTPLEVTGTTTITNAQVYRRATGDRVAAPLSGPIGSADLNHHDRLFALWQHRNAPVGQSVAAQSGQPVG